MCHVWKHILADNITDISNFIPKPRRNKEAEQGWNNNIEHVRTAAMLADGTAKDNDSGGLIEFSKFEP